VIERRVLIDESVAAAWAIVFEPDELEKVTAE
jgi:hypothetical protein